MKCLIFILSIFPILIFSQTEIEPNDEFSESNILGLNNIYQGFINETRDEDFYKFEIVQTGIIQFTLLDSPDNVNLHVWIYHSNDKDSILQRRVDVSNGELYKIDISTCKLGSYYLFIEDGGSGIAGGSAFNSSIPYKFKMEFTPFDLIDDCECSNQAIESACSIDLGVNNKASIAPRFGEGRNKQFNDNDFYKFRFFEPSIIKLSASNVPDNLNLQALFYNQDKEQFWNQTALEDGNDIEIWTSICDIGEYYLLLKDGSTVFNGGDDDYNINESYNFEVEAFPITDFDSCECNNDFESAHQIELCNPQLASFNPPFEKDISWTTVDFDYYKIDLQANQNIDLKINSESRYIETQIKIYDSTFASIEEFQTNMENNIDLSFNTKSSGTHYVEIRTRDNEFLNHKYELLVGCDLTNNINQIESENKIKIYPNPVSDIINIQLESQEINPYSIQIYDFIGALVYSENNITNNKLSLENLNTGIYFLKIETNNNTHFTKVIKN